MAKKVPKIKIINIDLTLENNYAQVDTETNIIELDYRLKGKTRLKKLIHELAHLAFPEANESEILYAEKLIGNGVWQEHYRKVDNRKK